MEVQFNEKELEYLAYCSSIVLVGNVAKAWEFDLESKVALMNKIQALRFELKKNKVVSDLINKQRGKKKKI